MLRLSRIRKKVILFGVGCCLILNFIYLYFLPEQIETRTAFHQYVHPHNSSIKGKKFDLNSRIYSLAMQLIAQLQNGKNLQEWSVEALVEAMTPVTAISSNHFHELLKHLGHFHRFIPNKRLIVYDLGLDPDHVYFLKRTEFVVYRKFDFSVFPRHVRNLRNYAWKTFIMQQVMAEHGGAMWLDSSIKIRKPYTKVLEQAMNSECGMLFLLPPSGHNFASATHPKMLQYLPMTNLEEIKRLRMSPGGAILIFNTPEIRDRIFKWAILCSLHQDCIAPEGSTPYCDLRKFPEERNGGCHRYDQSMYGILAANSFNSQTRRYVIASKLRYVEVNRLDPPFYRQVIIFLKSWFFYLCNWIPFT